MGLIHESKTYGFYIRESANDGSDFSNPVADYRIVFLGEDGEWHSRDSAGTIAGFAGSGIAATLADAAGDILVASAADTWAKLAKGAAGGALSIINAAVAWNSGTSNPGSAVTGDRYWRTDLGLEIYYDGTRWLTVQEYTTDAWTVGLAATAQVGGHGFLVGGRDIWLLNVTGQAAVITTNNGTNFWTIAAYSNNAGGALGGNTSLGSASTAAFTAGVAADISISINAVLDVSATPAVSIHAEKTLSPGVLRFFGRLRYREIVT